MTNILGAASPGASGVRGGEGEPEVSKHARLFSPRASTPSVKTRLSEKRQIGEDTGFLWSKKLKMFVYAALRY